MAMKPGQKAARRFYQASLLIDDAETELMKFAKQQAEITLKLQNKFGLVMYVHGSQNEDRFFKEYGISLMLGFFLICLCCHALGK